jgi:hypothetical protein
MTTLIEMTVAAQKNPFLAANKNPFLAANQTSL